MVARLDRATKYSVIVCSFTRHQRSSCWSLSNRCIAELLPAIWNRSDFPVSVAVVVQSSLVLNLHPISDKGPWDKGLRGA